MTVGDVNAVIAGVAVTGGTLWAALVGISSLFGEKTERAASVVREQPGRTFTIGFFFAAIAGVIGIVLVNSPNGVLKLVGWAALLVLAALATLGSAGIASLLAERITPLDSKLSRLGSRGRAAAFLVASGFLPFIGWVGFFPLLFFMSLGAGCRVMVEKRLPVREVILAESSPAIEG